MLKKYRKRRGISGKDTRHVFSSQTHEKMTVSCIEEIFATYVIEARHDNPGQFRNHYTPHFCLQNAVNVLLDNIIFPDFLYGFLSF